MGTKLDFGTKTTVFIEISNKHINMVFGETYKIH